MMKFFRLNPIGVTSSKFCGLRLLAILQKIAPLEAVDMPTYPWLLAQYKIGTKQKLEEILTVTGDENDDDAATSDSDANKELAKRYSLSVTQLVQCQEHLESILIQYCQWNEEALQRAREEELRVLNDHSSGLGDALWNEVESKVRALFHTGAMDEESQREEWMPLSITQDSGSRYCVIS